MIKLEVTKLERLIAELEVLIISLRGFRRLARDLAIYRDIYR